MAPIDSRWAWIPFSAEFTTTFTRQWSASFNTGVKVLNYRILGPLEIWTTSGQVRLSGSKRQAFLGALLLAGGMPVSLAQLIDTVWGHHAPATAVKQIRNAASDLRRSHPEIGEQLLMAGDGYQLRIDEDRLDAKVFSHGVTRARRLVKEGLAAAALEEFRSALSLWRGSALAGLDRPALQAQVDGLNELRLSVLEECFELELAEGEHKSIVGDLALWVAEHPLRERLISQLMLALFRSGSQARALTVYEQARQRLKEELGVDPGAELQEVHQYILVNGARRSGFGAPSLRHNNLPARSGNFTGRIPEQRLIEKAARAAGADRGGAGSVPAVVAIDGMAGVGKTTLAVHAAYQLADSYPDAQLYVDMSACSAGKHPLTAWAALGILLSGLGVPPRGIPTSLEQRATTWRRMMADRRALIVLDDVADTQQILLLLTGAPGSLTIVTSRNRLTEFMSTCQLTLQEMSPAEGGEMFSRIAGEKRAWRERAAVDDIVALCGGLPLAIRIAAAKLCHRPSWTVSYLASRLADEGRRLSVLDDEDGRLTQVFQQSYDGLTYRQQLVFRVLGRLPSDNIKPHAVARLTGLSAARVDQLLESLVDAHLIEATGPGRYRIHELLHAYATQLAEAADVTDAADGGHDRAVATRLADRRPAGQVVEALRELSARGPVRATVACTGG
ncbi:NB-ARC domain-containing protein [Streptomyces sp. ASQP_92]|uniref:AfsR/SARP family transcriptional regulator n=1 Tax=Streptomyces sp. ASQP_92 TaxID=2979116 RepID=UPI0021BE8AED|nr:BTAD domain-containing putative transcriptional regulator [Streptomyces sp. ASQP_92]MCT9093792.1 NB-ARC domain-containing protein [Streptomyces sp. ASQP_92]